MKFQQIDLTWNKMTDFSIEAFECRFTEPECSKILDLANTDQQLIANKMLCLTGFSSYKETIEGSHKMQRRTS